MTTTLLHSHRAQDHTGPCLLAVAPHKDNGEPGTIRHGALAALAEAGGIIEDGDAIEATLEDLRITRTILLDGRSDLGTVMVAVTREELAAFTRVTELGHEYLGNVDRDESDGAITGGVWQCWA